MEVEKSFAHPSYENIKYLKCYTSEKKSKKSNLNGVSDIRMHLLKPATLTVKLLASLKLKARTATQRNLSHC